MDTCPGMYFIDTTEIVEDVAELYCANTCAEMEALYQLRNIKDVTLF